MNKKIYRFTLLLLVLSFTISGCEKKEELLQPAVTPVDVAPDPADKVSPVTVEDSVYQQNTIKENAVNEASAKENTNEKDSSEDFYFIHIYGAVLRPGVYEVPAGSRIFEVVEAASGFSEDAATDAVNLALPAEDGSKIMIPTWEEANQAEAAWLNAVSPDMSTGSDNSLWVSGPDRGGYPEAGSLPEEQDYLVNINTATLDLLCTLPGIGKVKAESIIAYREEQGGFRHVEDIMKVDGIKEGLFNQISERITV